MKQIIEIKKNCDNCIKQDACKFLSQYNALVRSNEFYSMFEYLEWNNLERIFKDNAPAYKCYHQAFPDGKLSEAHPYEVWDIVFKKHVNNKWKYFSRNEEGEFIVRDENNQPVTKEILAEIYEISVVNRITK